VTGNTFFPKRSELDKAEPVKARFHSESMEWSAQAMLALWFLASHARPAAKHGFASEKRQHGCRNPSGRYQVNAIRSPH